MVDIEKRYIEDIPKLPVVYILPYTEDGKFVLREKQGEGKKIWEFLNGEQSNTLNLMQTATNLLEEEAGYTFQEMHVMGTLPKGNRTAVLIHFSGCKCKTGKSIKENIIEVDKKDIEKYLGKGSL